MIGTTGIVTPQVGGELEALLAIELEQCRAEGHDSVILVPGNHGGALVAAHLSGVSAPVITMSNFVGYMLHIERLAFRHVLLAGHLGKPIKVAAGVFHTHSHIADARMETLVTQLALLGAPTHCWAMSITA